jgi:simple sugar transport system substrate-binding protein/ribose transport system substrate-binding protein
MTKPANSGRSVLGAWFAAAGCVAAVLSGCGRTGGTAAGPQAPRIAGIVFQEDQFFRLVQFGMKDAAEKAGAELLLANSANKPDKEIDLVNTYLARKVDAIVVSPLSAKASAAALKRAAEKGVRVVTFNSTVEGDVPAAQIESDQADLGAQTGAAARKYIEEKLGGKARVAILAFKSQVAEQSDARTQGFKREVQKLPGVAIVAEQDAWLPELGVKKAGDILTANPDVNVIWAANEGGTVGAAMAVKNAGKAGKVAVFGTDSSQQLLDLLQSPDDVLQAVASQRPVDMGTLAVETALKVLRGETVEKHTKMPGILLTRADPAGLEAFAKMLKQWMGRDPSASGQ